MLIFFNFVQLWLYFFRCIEHLSALQKKRWNKNCMLSPWLVVVISGQKGLFHLCCCCCYWAKTSQRTYIISRLIVWQLSTGVQCLNAYEAIVIEWALLHQSYSQNNIHTTTEMAAYGARVMEEKVADFMRNVVCRHRGWGEKNREKNAHLFHSNKIYADKWSIKYVLLSFVCFPCFDSSLFHFSMRLHPSIYYFLCVCLFWVFILPWLLFGHCM